MVVLLLATHARGSPDAPPADAEHPGTRLLPVADIRGMSLKEAALGKPVRIRGVVIYMARDHQPKTNAMIVQDGTAGIWVPLDLVEVPDELTRGREVEVEGRTDRGGFAPNLIATSVRDIGPGEFPEPRAVSDDHFFSGADTCSRVTVEGIFQGFRDDDTKWLLILERSGRRFMASVPKPFLTQDPASLVDAKVRLTGVATSNFNTRGEFVSPRVTVQIPGGLTVLEPPRSKPFDAPFVPLDLVGQFRPEPVGGHRIRTEGTVTFVKPNTFIQVQDGPVGMRVHTRTNEDIAVGDRVEIAGFLDRGRDTMGLAEAEVRRIRKDQPLEPEVISPDAIIAIVIEAKRAGLVAKPGNFDGCLIRFPAHVVEIAASRGGGMLTLMSGESSIQASLQHPEFERLSHVQPGSTLDVTGIIQIDRSDAYEERELWYNTVPSRLSLLLRSADDVVVVAAPSWWTPRRLAVALAAVGGVLTLSLGWASALQRQLAVQTTKLADEMRSRREAAVEFQATLRERNRLAANLHDTLLQSLAGIRFQLDACRVVSRQGRDDASAEHFAVARRMLDHAAQDLRGSVWALRTMPMPGQTFSEAIEALVDQTARTHDKPVVLNLVGTPFEVPNFVAGNLLLVAQEAIRNAVQHGQPGRINVHVAFDPDAAAIDLVVHDDGKGFEPGTQVGSSQGHFGLQGMHERIERLGGKLEITTSPGRGTTVHATVTMRAYDRQLEESPESVIAGDESSVTARP